MLLLEIKNDWLSCKIAPEMGGAIYSFDYVANETTQHLMRPTPSEDCHLITDYSSWPLVPFSNRINKGKFSFDGKSYRVPVTWLGPPHHASHGHGWERPWHIARQDETSCELTFSFDDKVIWPFAYKAKQAFRLADHVLQIDLTLTNADFKPMPAGLGLHPYFIRTPGTTLKATVEHLWEIDEHTIPLRRIVVPKEYDFSTPKVLDNIQLDHCFDGYGGSAEITWPGQPMKLRLTSSDNLRHFVVYTPAGKDFFCAEPVSHLPNAINRQNESGTGLVILDPGQSMTVSYNFAAIPA